MIKEDMLQNTSPKLLFEKRSTLRVDAYFTIAIPTFNRSELLKEAVESVLNQKYDDHFHLIIVDNNSEKQEIDEILRFLKKTKIPFNVTLKFFSNLKNIGMFPNWNRCVGLCETSYISILNDDDLIESDFLYDVSRNISENMMLVVGITSFNNAKSEISFFNKFLKFRLMRFFLGRVQYLKFEDLFIGNPVKGSLGAVFKKDLLKELGGYKEEYFPSSDYYLTYEFWNHYGIKRLNKPLARYRWSENESLKIEVLKGFLIWDVKLRNQMILNKIKKPILIYRSFLKRIVRINICLYKKINSDFNPYEIERNKYLYDGPYFCFFVKFRLLILYFSIKLMNLVFIKR